MLRDDLEDRLHGPQGDAADQQYLARASTHGLPSSPASRSMTESVLSCNVTMPYCYETAGQAVDGFR